MGTSRGRSGGSPGGGWRWRERARGTREKREGLSMENPKRATTERTRRERKPTEAVSGASSRRLARASPCADRPISAQPTARAWLPVRFVRFCVRVGWLGSPCALGGGWGFNVPISAKCYAIIIGSLRSGFTIGAKPNKGRAKSKRSVFFVVFVNSTQSRVITTRLGL